MRGCVHACGYVDTRYQNDYPQICGLDRIQYFAVFIHLNKIQSMYIE